MVRTLCALCVCLLLAACGGGGGSSGSSAATTTTAPSAPPLSNFATLTVDTGPSVLQTGSSPYIADNIAYVAVTLCASGTTNCQTIDHIQVDTGSVGLRVFSSAVTPSVLAALPNQTDSNNNPVGECYGYVDGYVFGSVRQADFKIGGETVANMPFQLVGDTGAFATAPATCTSGGGTNLNTVQSVGANGILGIGVSTTDCGTLCATPGKYGTAIYYACPNSGCSSVTTRAALTTAPFEQVPNPVAAMGVDNNGTIVTFPSVPAAGQATLTGTLYFGIGTQTNNGLGTATVLPTSLTGSRYGSGLVTAVYNGQSLPQSYIDSGTNIYAFVDQTIAACTGADYVGYYCPASPLTLKPTIQGTNGASATPNLMLYNAKTLLSGSYAVLPGVGGNPNLFSDLMGYPSSFAFGLPFFYGRSVYTALEGRTAGGSVGPYYAF